MTPSVDEERDRGMDNDFILVLDLGGPQAITMARKLRAQRYYTEIMSRSADIELFRRKSPRGILIVGADDCETAESFPRAVLSLGIPVLAMGGAARMLALAMGAVSQGTLLKDSASMITFQPCELFDQMSESDRYFARVDGFELPECLTPIATTVDGLVPGFADIEHNLFALQFYAESNDPDGAVILSNFAERICGCTPFWSIETYIEEELRYIRERVGDSTVLMAVSGGLDSTTCAALMQRAIGDKMLCVFIDNGLLREHEAETVVETLRDQLGFRLIYIDARERFLARLKGITDPLEKHHATHNEFMNCLSDVCIAHPEAEYVVKGTIYSDLLDSNVSDEPYARNFEDGKLLEPVRMLFKDEVRDLSQYLELPSEIINRQSFPCAGLALRCCGEVTEQKLSLLRNADAILHDVMLSSDQAKRLTQWFTVLTNTFTLGQREGSGQYEYACVIRAVSENAGSGFSVGKLPYDLLDRLATRITQEIPGINRVVYDITDSDTAAIEWE